MKDTIAMLWAFVELFATLTLCALMMISGWKMLLAPSLTEMGPWLTMTLVIAIYLNTRTDRKNTKEERE